MSNGQKPGPARCEQAACHSARSNCTALAPTQACMRSTHIWGTRWQARRLRKWGAARGLHVGLATSPMCMSSAASGLQRASWQEGRVGSHRWQSVQPSSAGRARGCHSRAAFLGKQAGGELLHILIVACAQPSAAQQQGSSGIHLDTALDEQELAT